jgi:Fe-S cluster assembly scaffold protein SufB
VSSNTQLITDLYNSINADPHQLKDPNVAHMEINHNRVLGMHAVPGLNIDVDELDDGISAKIVLDEGTQVANPVHLCFGMLPKEGIQRIVLDVNIGAGAKISLLAHCTFPFAVDVQHLMNAEIKVGEDAEYSYFERHVHSPSGGVQVIPKAAVEVARNALFKTEFELLKGRVGMIDIDYEATCHERAVLDMSARISGRSNDHIKIHETAHLIGEYARGVLTSKIAVRDSARAEVYNKVTASAAFARGHVDCKEIIQDEGQAQAVPIVDVRHPKAHVTHEAAIGSVDSKQLETLMARGLDEDEAVEVIISGLLSR